MATEILCLQLDDDERIVDGLKQAIEEHESPELVRVQPASDCIRAGLWVRDNLANRDELARAKSEGRYYRDDRSTFQWVWVPDEDSPLPAPAAPVDAVEGLKGLPTPDAEGDYEFPDGSLILKCISDSGTWFCVFPNGSIAGVDSLSPAAAHAALVAAGFGRMEAKDGKA